MAKRRKRTTQNVPAKGRLRDLADKLWSWAVREDWGHKCARCRATNVEAHHLVPRQMEGTRYSIRNGMALCPRCHKFDREFSPHQNAAGFISWLESEHPELAEWYFENRRPEFSGTKNAAYYCDVIRSLRPFVEPEDFERIVGVRFADYLGEFDANVDD